jgi:hypothetical protein
LMLLLLMGGFYGIRSLDGFMWRDIRNKFHEECYRRSSNIEVSPQKF